MSRNVHQDYIVRQRYSNALPPPPGAPKLLDIPTGGLKQYTMPTYASRLARVQPLNIEADADLGMPIDLVGMPGVFEGDETAILAPLHRPTPHPADRNLLRPLKEIGQAKKEGGISFLRRTQYTADGGVARGVGAPMMGITPRKRRVEAPKDDPRAILRTAIKGFELANPEDTHTGLDTAEKTKGAPPTPAEAEAWRNPKHPKNKALKPVDFYPVLPDMEAMPADGAYMVVRFHGDPGAIEDDDFKAPEHYRADPRIDTSLLQLVDTPAETMADYSLRKDLYEKDPDKHKDPGLPPFDYQYYLPIDLNNTESAMKAFDAGATSADQVEQLYTTVDEENPEKNGFDFKHARFYETRSNMEHLTKYERVAMVLHDGDEAAEEDDLGLGDDDSVRKLPKGAYYVPTANTIFLKPKRTIAKLGREAGTEDSRIDLLHVRPKELDGALGDARKAIVDALQP